jgi:hypothetical protein
MAGMTVPLPWTAVAGDNAGVTVATAMTAATDNAVRRIHAMLIPTL